MNRFCCVLIAAVLTLGTASAQERGRGGRGPGGPPLPAKASALIDLTGYWVAYITEDWRFRMMTPPKGDFAGVPMTPEARRVAALWDPDADQRNGEQCRSYGAAALMRVPGRLHITWQDDNALRVDADAGTQTRIFTFGIPGGPPAAGVRTWQGQSIAQWQRPEQGRGAPPPQGGALKVLTTNMRAGYLRKNGVPYSENAVLTEYFDVGVLPGVGPVLVVTSMVEDPRYLMQPFIINTHFKKEAEGAKWDPQPCTSK